MIRIKHDDILMAMGHQSIKIASLESDLEAAGATIADLQRQLGEANLRLSKVVSTPDGPAPVEADS